MKLPAACYRLLANLPPIPSTPALAKEPGRQFESQVEAFLEIRYGEGFQEERVRAAKRGSASGVARRKDGPQFRAEPETPACKFGDPWDESCIESFASLLRQHSASIAAVILEPIVQGAGGMRFYSPEYLKRVRQLCNEENVLLVLDEIATGFLIVGD